MDKSVIIWFKNGKTAMFKNVEEFNCDGDEIKFNYFGESTQVKRTCLFNRSDIAGCAVQI